MASCDIYSNNLQSQNFLLCDDKTDTILTTDRSITFTNLLGMTVSRVPPPNTSFLPVPVLTHQFNPLHYPLATITAMKCHNYTERLSVHKSILLSFEILILL